MPVGLERLITMADTEREKKKKPFMADYVEHHRKKEEAAKKAKKDKKEREKSLRDADRKAELANEYLADRNTDMTFAEYEKSLRAADRKAAELDRYLADRDTDMTFAEYVASNKKKKKEGDFNKGGVVKLKKKPKVTKKTYSRGFRKPKYNG